MPDIYQFKVNGVMRETVENKPLLRYLRDDLHLYSVKDGCSVREDFSAMGILLYGDLMM